MIDNKLNFFSGMLLLISHFMLGTNRKFKHGKIQRIPRGFWFIFGRLLRLLPCLHLEGDFIIGFDFNLYVCCTLRYSAATFFLSFRMKLSPKTFIWVGGSLCPRLLRGSLKKPVITPWAAFRKRCGILKYDSIMSKGGSPGKPGIRSSTSPCFSPFVAFSMFSIRSIL